MPHCYVCKKPKHHEEFYNDNSRSCGKQSKCKRCADRRRNARNGHAVADFDDDGMTDREYLMAMFDKQTRDYNAVPNEYHGGAQADGVYSVRGKKTKNRPKKQIWGNKIRT